MKILFIFTGGTIGSTANGSFIGTDSNKPYILLERYKNLYGIDFSYDTAEPYTELSENSTGETIQRLIAAVSENIDKGYDGIIVTHGTDTIQYSAAALAYSVRTDIPIMIVSSNYPIEEPNSNGLLNLRGAVAFIQQVAEAGVWVPYSNNGREVDIHCAARLLATNAFSDSIFSVKNQYYGRFDSDLTFHRNTECQLLPDEIKHIPCGDLTAAASHILQIEPYPGMVYPSIDGIDYIIHKSYHSGTINTKCYYPEDFFEKAKNNGTVIFATGIATGNAYESTKLFDKLSVIPVANIAPIAAYVKLWLCVSSGADPRELLGSSLSGDLIAR